MGFLIGEVGSASAVAKPIIVKGLTQSSRSNLGHSIFSTFVLV